MDDVTEKHPFESAGFLSYFCDATADVLCLIVSWVGLQCLNVVFLGREKTLNSQTVITAKENSS